MAFTVITVLGVETDHMRKSLASGKGTVDQVRVALATRATTKILLMRYDDEHQTLRASDRCMNGRTSQKHGIETEAEAARKKQAFDPDRKPWHKLKPRVPDKELQQNSQAMNQVCHPAGLRKDSGELKAKPKSHKSLGDSEPFKDEIDPEGWPEKNSQNLGGTFSQPIGCWRKTCAAH